MIAFLILFLNWVNTTGEYILSRTVLNAATGAVAAGTAGGLSVEQYIGKFYAEFLLGVSVAGLLIQLFLVSRIDHLLPLDRHLQPDDHCAILVLRQRYLYQ